jgi:trehalose 6-phosphate synthase
MFRKMVVPIFDLDDPTTPPPRDDNPTLPRMTPQPTSSAAAAAAARKDSLASLASHLESTRTEGEQRLIIVSNRLPVTIKKDTKTGEYTYKMSSGGLVSALSGCKKTMNFTWIGWPGQDVGWRVPTCRFSNSVDG